MYRYDKIVGFVTMADHCSAFDGTAYAIEQCILARMHNLAIVECSHPIASAVVRTKREIRQAKRQPPQQFFRERICDASRTQATFEVHYAATRQAARDRTEPGRQRIAVHDNQRRRLRPVPDTSDETKTTQQSPWQPRDQSDNAGALSLLLRTDELRSNIKIVDQVIDGLVVLSCKPDQVLQSGLGGQAQYGRKLDQLRPCANDENALPHSQDLL